MASRYRCHFCGSEYGKHTAHCAVNNTFGEEQYFRGYAAGTAALPALNSSHPMFLRGWCNGLRDINQPRRRS